LDLVIYGEDCGLSFNLCQARTEDSTKETYFYIPKPRTVAVRKMTCQAVHHCCCHHQVPCVSSTTTVPKKKKKSPSALRRDNLRRQAHLQKKLQTTPKTEGNQTEPVDINPSTPCEDAVRDLTPVVLDQREKIEELENTIHRMTLEHFLDRTKCEDDFADQTREVIELQDRLADLQNRLAVAWKIPSDTRQHEKVQKHNKSLQKQISQKDKAMEKMKMEVDLTRFDMKKTEEKAQHHEKENNRLAKEISVFQTQIVKDPDLKSLNDNIQELQQIYLKKPKSLVWKCYNKILAQFAKLMSVFYILHPKHQDSDVIPLQILDSVLLYDNSDTPIRYFLVEYQCNCPPQWTREAPHLNPLIGRFYKKAKYKFDSSDNVCKSFPPK